MPGISFYAPPGGNAPVPDIRDYLLANSLNGTGTPPANSLQAGDLVALTQNTSLTSGGNTVVRQLLAADLAALYKESTPIAGILGIAMDSANSNASGVATTAPPLGGVTTTAPPSYPYSYAGMQAPDDATGRSRERVAVFRSGFSFLGALYVGGGAITLQHQYDDTLAGFKITTTAGITTYTIDVGATTKCLRIIGPNTQDPLYNVLTGTTFGPTVIFELLGPYEQALTGVVYSSQ